MTGYTLSSRVGRIRAAEIDFMYVPDKVREGSHPFFHFHGANSPLAFGSSASYPETMLGARLAAEGIVCIGGQQGGNTFGNDLSQTLITTMISLADAIPGVDVSKIHMAGASMGNAPQFRYAGNNPTKVASILGLIPYSDPVAVRDSNRLGLRTTIEAAWSIGNSDPLPSQALLKETHAPVVNSNGIPYLAYYAGDDTAALPAEVTTLAGLAGGTAINVGNYGHTAAAINAAALYDGGPAWQHYIEWSGILNV